MPNDPFAKLPFGRLDQLAENPFAPDSELAPVVDNSILTPVGPFGGQQSPQYNVVLPNRAVRVFVGGLFGSILALAALVLCVFGTLGVPLASIFLGLFTFPLSVVAILCTQPSGKLGRRDLADIAEGTVAGDRLALLQWGVRLATWGTLLAGLSLGLFFVAVIRFFLGA